MNKNTFLIYLVGILITIMINNNLFEKKENFDSISDNANNILNTNYQQSQTNNTEENIKFKKEHANTNEKSNIMGTYLFIAIISIIFILLICCISSISSFFTPVSQIQEKKLSTDNYSQNMTDTTNLDHIYTYPNIIPTKIEPYMQNQIQNQIPNQIQNQIPNIYQIPNQMPNQIPNVYQIPNQIPIVYQMHNIPNPYIILKN